MLENPLRRSAKDHSTIPSGIRRPDSPAIIPHRVGPPSAPTGPSFAQRKAHQPRSSNHVLVEGNNVMRSIDRPLPGDVVGRRKPLPHPDVIRKQSAYFESEFALTNRVEDPVKARIRSEAMVNAELQTNVIIRDELVFMTDMAQHLSNRYQRPVSSINVTLHHGICMLFAGTLEPACTLTIHALPSLLQPATNKRNAALIQQYLYESLGIVSKRGYIRFEATTEENVAVGGKTLAAEVDELSREIGDRKSGLFRKPSTSRGIINSVKSLGKLKSGSTVNLAGNGNAPTPPPSNSGETTRDIATIPEVPPTPPDDERREPVEEPKARKATPRRKSLRFAIFGNKSSMDG